MVPEPPIAGAVAANKKGTTGNHSLSERNRSVVPLSDRPKVLSAKAPATIAGQIQFFIGRSGESFRNIF
jgi:hypothetical protein